MGRINIRWIDTHCHLQMLDDPAAAMEDAVTGGIDHVVCVGVDLASSEVAVSAAHAQPDRVSATVGLHPHDASGFTGEWEALSALANDPAVVAVGECGFDFYRNLSMPSQQETAFAAQIELAKALDLALVIHTRDAWDATLSMLRAVGAPDRTVFHCFSGGPEEARACLDLGAYLSFAGPVGYPKNETLRDAARGAPLDRIVVETDAPFLSPQKYRGKPNAPVRVALVGEALADAVGRPAEAVATATTANARRLFRLDGT